MRAVGLIMSSGDASTASAFLGRKKVVQGGQKGVPSLSCLR